MTETGAALCESHDEIVEDLDETLALYQNVREMEEEENYVQFLRAKEELDKAKQGN